MKRLLIFVSALSALTNLHAMEPRRPANAAQHVVKPGFFFELAALCTADTFRPRDAFKLCKHINFEAVPALCGINAHRFQDYFNMNELQDFLSSSADDYEFRSHARKDLLKRSLKIQNWERLLECTRLESVITIILDLIYLSEYNADQLTTHIRCIDELIADNIRNNLLSSFNLEELKAILCELMERRIEPDLLSKARVLRTITPLASIKKQAGTDPLIKYVSIDGLFKFFSTIVLADVKQSDELTIELLIECISWKHFVAVMPRLLHMTNSRFATLANLDNIEEVITAFQRGTPITADQLTSCFNQHAFPAEGIPFSWITGQVNFQELAHALNELRKGRAVDLSRICDPELLRLAGMDLDRATDPHQPLPVQLEARSALINQITDTRAFNAVKYYLLPACFPVLLWLATQALCPTCLSLATPPQIVAQVLTLLLAYALVIAHERLEKPTLGTRLVLNGAAHSAAAYVGLHSLSRLRERQPLVSDIVKNIPSLAAEHAHKPAEQALRQLVTSLTDEQVRLLPRASDLLTLLTDPVAFILDQRNELFITKLYEDQRTADAYLTHLATIVSIIHPSTILSHNAAFDEFAAGAFNEFGRLSCSSLMSLARYNPHLLIYEHRFLRALDGTSYERFQALLGRVPRR